MTIFCKLLEYQNSLVFYLMYWDVLILELFLLFSEGKYSCTNLHFKFRIPLTTITNQVIGMWSCGGIKLYVTLQLREK